MSRIHDMQVLQESVLQAHVDFGKFLNQHKPGDAALQWAIPLYEFEARQVQLNYMILQELGATYDRGVTGSLPWM